MMADGIKGVAMNSKVGCKKARGRKERIEGKENTERQKIRKKD